ncbi:hypothetical protein ZIOFF_006974 [Zingiber officinale]|uniref:Uncharacterized protein n=1 Tax=Zingiber officinale TaxID=94328 RepID=A0A8J5HZI6_ZINOF|nr:hypothetical protein ZIOFF_006974 [Zingiber officinale]
MVSVQAIIANMLLLSRYLHPRHKLLRLSLVPPDDRNPRHRSYCFLPHQKEEALRSVEECEADLSTSVDGVSVNCQVDLACILLIDVGFI